MIPITTVRLGEDEEQLVLEVLRSGQLAQGKLVEEFEAKFAELHGVKHAVAVNNGTTALVVAMKAIGVGPGDEVITSPFTFVATLNAIIEAGATARFADIGQDFNIDVSAITSLITPQTRAVMPVHLYGYMADMNPIMDIARQHNLRIVEDAAQAVSATYFDKGAGSFDIGCFSLYATKNLTTGEGGVVTTNDDAIADRIRLLRNQGMRERYQYEIAGSNFRLTNLAAAVGLPQLYKLHTFTSRRQYNANRLVEGLIDVPGILLPATPETGRTHVYHQFTIRVSEEASVSRNDAVSELTRRGIGCGIYYPRVVFDYECYRHDSRVVRDDVPVATNTASQVLSLPVHPYLTDEDLETIIHHVGEVFGG